MNIHSIAKFIENNAAEVIGNIDSDKIRIYNFLQEQYQNSDITDNFIFQYTYRQFYGLDSSFLTPEFKTEYFNILEENKGSKSIDCAMIMKRLFQFKNQRGDNTINFPCVSKLMSTIDNNLPICDNQLARMFELYNPYMPEFDVRIQSSITHLKTIEHYFKQIIKEGLLRKSVEKFDNRFKNHNLSEIKRLDFIFASAVKLKDKKIAEDRTQTQEQLFELDRLEHIERAWV